MADIQSIDMSNHEIVVNLKITNSEYELLKNSRYNLVLLPSSYEVLDRHLTTGKLGNSNRIMVPKKMLEKDKVKLDKKVPAKIFKINGNAFLLIMLNKSGTGIPVFEEVKNE
jgi:hypothetical protein